MMHGQMMAQLRDEFLSSDTGKRLIEGTASGQYLKNRIERAFLEGMRAAEDLKTERIRPSDAD